MSVFLRVENPIEGPGGVPVSDIAAAHHASGLASASSTGAPRAVLSWLQNILRERLHAHLELRNAGTGYYEIRLGQSSRRIRIACQYALFDRDTNDLPCGRWAPPLDTWLPAGLPELPTPGMSNPPAALIQADEQGHVLHYDVMSLTYWMLSRREEVAGDRLDANQRFPAEASHAYQHGYLERPIVDEWLQVLAKVMQATWTGIELSRSRYRMTLTHDVDTPARYALVSGLRLMRNMMVDLLRERQRSRRALIQAPAIWARSRHRLDDRDPFNTFDWIMDRSEEAGLRNAFYFICGHTDRQRDGTYSPDDPAVLELMRGIHQRGHEVGLHPSYHTYLNPKALRVEADRLRCARQAAGIPDGELGARMHYLRWKTPDTLYALEAADLAYDTTLGYAKHPGFRCGTCHEYPAFDPVAKRALTLRLRPLVVMESTVIQGMGAQDVNPLATRLSKLMQACQRVHGNFTLLWHNTLLEHAPQRRLYETVLHCHKGLAP